MCQPVFQDIAWAHGRFWGGAQHHHRRLFQEPPVHSLCQKSRPQLEKHGCLFVLWERGRGGISERPGSKVSSGTEAAVHENFVPHMLLPGQQKLRLKIPDDTENEEDRKTLLTHLNNEGSSEFILMSSPNLTFKSHSHTNVLTRSACGHGKHFVSRVSSAQNPGEQKRQVWASREWDVQWGHWADPAAQQRRDKLHLWFQSYQRPTAQ